jgi:hypothetical protein
VVATTSPVVLDEVDCANCSIFLADLALFKEKHAFVTTPPEIIPYYRLNHSTWSLSDNKEASR